MPYTWLRSAALVVALIVLLPGTGFAADGGATSAGGKDAITANVGSPPIYCAAQGEQQEICTWHYRSAYHVVCRLDRAGQRAAPCENFPDNEKMRTWNCKPGLKARNRGGVVCRSKQQIAAGEELQRAAESLAGVIEVVGAGPVWCGSGDDVRERAASVITPT